MQLMVSMDNLKDNRAYLGYFSRLKGFGYAGNRKNVLHMEVEHMQSGRLEKGRRDTQNTPQNSNSGGGKGKNKLIRRTLALGIAITLAVTTPSVNVGLMKMQAADDAELEAVLEADGLEKEEEVQEAELISFKDEALNYAVQNAGFTIDTTTNKVTSANIEYNGSMLVMDTDFTADAVLKSTNTKTDRIISTYDVTVTGLGLYTDSAVAKGVTVQTAIETDSGEIEDEIEAKAASEDASAKKVSLSKALKADSGEVTDSSVVANADTGLNLNLDEYNLKFEKIKVQDPTYENEIPTVLLKGYDFSNGYDPGKFYLQSKTVSSSGDVDIISYDTIIENSSEITISRVNFNSYTVGYEYATLTLTGSGTCTGSAVAKLILLEDKDLIAYVGGKSPEYKVSDGD
nr:hypothetical protein [Lachnospiraceae bacterium]